MSRFPIPQHEELRSLWEQYLRDGIPEPILAFLQKNPQARVPCGHDYPHLHRVYDVILNGQAHRVLRCSACEEEITLQPIPKKLAAVDEPGVPYWLSGSKLQRWVEDEIALREEDADETTDWERYR